MSKIQEAIDNMSVAEMKERLATYMAADKEWAPKPIAIEVRHRDTKDVSGSNIYDIIAILDNDTEVPIKFRHRNSMVLYVYTLMHPNGYKRASLDKRDKGFPELASLYNTLFMSNPKRLIEQAEKDYDHFFSMAAADIHKTIGRHVGLEELTFDSPRQHNDRTLIPAVKNGLQVIIDRQLSLSI